MDCLTKNDVGRGAEGEQDGERGMMTRLLDGGFILFLLFLGNQVWIQLEMLLYSYQAANYCSIRFKL